jgi:hypothetical protein
MPHASVGMAPPSPTICTRKLSTNEILVPSPRIMNDFPQF